MIAGPQAYDFVTVILSTKWKVNELFEGGICLPVWLEFGMRYIPNSTRTI